MGRRRRKRKRRETTIIELVGGPGDGELYEVPLDWGYVDVDLANTRRVSRRAVRFVARYRDRGRCRRCLPLEAVPLFDFEKYLDLKTAGE